MTTTTNNLGLFKYVLSTDQNMAFNIETALNQNWDILDANWNTGTSRNIGEIIISTIPLTDAGLHLLDGGWIELNGSYREFVEYILSLYSSYPNLFADETGYNYYINNYGVCGKFYYDGVNQRLRLPKITGFVEGTTDATALGDLVEAGLPNITGSFASAYSTVGTDCVSTPTLYNAPSKTYNAATGEYLNSISYIDASRSSAIYGNSSTVQPQAIKVLYYIVIANSTKTDIQVDIDEIATDLNGKADVDLTNCTKPHIVETYSNGTSWYRVYSDGWCEQGGIVNTDNGYGNVSLLKSYENTAYIINVSLALLYIASATYADIVAIDSITASSFRILSCDNVDRPISTRVAWQACGYIA